MELRIPDISKARERRGFERKVDLEEGLLRMIDWPRERADVIRLARPDMSGKFAIDHERFLAFIRSIRQ